MIAENDPYRKGPLTAITNKSLERPGRLITIGEPAENKEISFGLCQAIMTDCLGVRRLTAMFLPKQLYVQLMNGHQKTLCKEKLLALLKSKTCLSTSLRATKAYVYGYHEKTKTQSFEYRFKDKECCTIQARNEGTPHGIFNRRTCFRPFFMN